MNGRELTQQVVPDVEIELNHTPQRSTSTRSNTEVAFIRSDVPASSLDPAIPVEPVSSLVPIQQDQKQEEQKKELPGPDLTEEQLLIVPQEEMPPLSNGNNQDGLIPDINNEDELMRQLNKNNNVNKERGRRQPTGSIFDIAGNLRNARSRSRLRKTNKKRNSGKNEIDDNHDQDAMVDEKRNEGQIIPPSVEVEIEANTIQDIRDEIRREQESQTQSQSQVNLQNNQPAQNQQQSQLLNNTQVDHQLRRQPAQSQLSSGQIQNQLENQQISTGQTDIQPTNVRPHDRQELSQLSSQSSTSQPRTRNDNINDNEDDDIEDISRAFEEQPTFDRYTNRRISGNVSRKRGNMSQRQQRLLDESECSFQPNESMSDWLRRKSSARRVSTTTDLISAHEANLFKDGYQRALHDLNNMQGYRLPPQYISHPLRKRRRTDIAINNNINNNLGSISGNINDVNILLQGRTPSQQLEYIGQQQAILDDLQRNRNNLAPTQQTIISPLQIPEIQEQKELTTSDNRLSTGTTQFRSPTQRIRTTSPIRRVRFQFGDQNDSQNLNQNQNQIQTTNNVGSADAQPRPAATTIPTSRTDRVSTTQQERVTPPTEQTRSQTQATQGVTQRVATGGSGDPNPNGNDDDDDDNDDENENNNDNVNENENKQERENKQDENVNGTDIDATNGITPNGNTTEERQERDRLLQIREQIRRQRAQYQLEQDQLEQQRRRQEEEQKTHENIIREQRQRLQNILHEAKQEREQLEQLRQQQSPQQPGITNVQHDQQQSPRREQEQQQRNRGQRQQQRPTQQQEREGSQQRSDNQEDTGGNQEGEINIEDTTGDRSRRRNDRDDDQDDNDRDRNNERNGGDRRDDGQGQGNDNNELTQILQNLTRIVGNRNREQTLEEKLNYEREKAYYVAEAKIAIEEKLKFDATFEGATRDTLNEAVRFRHRIDDYVKRNKIDENDLVAAETVIPRICSSFTGYAKRIWIATTDKESFTSIKDWKERWLDVHFPIKGALKEYYKLLSKWKMQKYATLLTCTDTYEVLILDYERCFAVSNEEDQLQYEIKDMQHVFNIVRGLKIGWRFKIQERYASLKLSMKTIQELKDNYLIPLNDISLTLTSIFDLETRKGELVTGRPYRERDYQRRDKNRFRNTRTPRRETRGTNKNTRVPTIGRPTQPSQRRQVNAINDNRGNFNNKGKSNKGNKNVNKEQNKFKRIKYGKGKNWLSMDEKKKYAEEPIGTIYVNVKCNNCKKGGHLAIACRWLNHIRPGDVIKMDKRYNNMNKGSKRTKQKRGKQNKRGQRKDKRGKRSVNTVDKQKENDKETHSSNENNNDSSSTSNSSEKVVQAIQSKTAKKRKDKTNNSFLDSLFSASN